MKTLHIQLCFQISHDKFFVYIGESNIALRYARAHTHTYTHKCVHRVVKYSERCVDTETATVKSYALTLF